jgi:hypothetical protein
LAGRWYFPVSCRALMSAKFEKGGAVMPGDNEKTRHWFANGGF